MTAAGNPSPQVREKMQVTLDARNEARFNHAASILVENIPMGTYHHGQMVNYSSGGLYFECTIAYRPGAPIIFGIETSPYAKCPGVYRGHVRWCRWLSEKESLYDFGIGVAYLKPDLLRHPGRQSLSAGPDRQRPVSGGRRPPHGHREPENAAKRRLLSDDHGSDRRRNELRRHPRRSFGSSTLYASRNRIFKGSVKDISRGGMFIEAAGHITVGEQVNLAVPAVHRHRDFTLRGKIVRVDPRGLAIRFQRFIENE